MNKDTITFFIGVALTTIFTYFFCMVAMRNAVGVTNMEGAFLGVSPENGRLVNFATSLLVPFCVIGFMGFYILAKKKNTLISLAFSPVAPAAAAVLFFFFIVMNMG